MPGTPWQLSLFVVVMLPVLLSLGAWQLSRAEEKAQLMRDYQMRLADSPSVAGPDAAPFSWVQLSGKFSRRSFLLDNQIHNGKVGYWVLQEFVTDRGNFIVNRGWIAAPTRREDIPQVPVDDQLLSLVALVWPDMGLPPMFAEDIWDESYPVRVQRKEIGRIAARINGVPLELRLQEGSPGRLGPLPMQPHFGRETHQGYAAQWFGLAFVLVTGYIIVVLKSRKEHTRKATRKVH